MLKISLRLNLVLFFFFHIRIDTASDIFNLFPGFSVINFLDNLTLKVIERHMDMCSQLELEIDAVDQIELVDVNVLDAEEVALEQLLVRSRERLRKTRKTSLDFFLNARILDHVQERLELHVDL